MIDGVVQVVNEELGNFALLIGTTKAFLEPETDFFLYDFFNLEDFTLDKDLKHELPEILILDESIKEEFLIIDCSDVKTERIVEEFDLIHGDCTGGAVHVLDSVEHEEVEFGAVGVEGDGRGFRMGFFVQVGEDFEYFLKVVDEEVVFDGYFKVGDELFEEVGVELGDLFVDKVEEEPGEEDVEVEFFFVFDKGVSVLDIFGEFVKKPEGFIKIKVLQEVKSLSAELIIPEEGDDLVIKVLAYTGHNILACFIDHAYQFKSAVVDAVHVVRQVVELFWNFPLATVKRELVAGQVQFASDLALYVYEWLAYAYLQLYRFACCLDVHCYRLFLSPLSLLHLLRQLDSLLYVHQQFRYQNQNSLCQVERTVLLPLAHQ